MEVFLHDRIPSNRRATIMSLASSFSYLWFFSFAGLFSLVLPKFGARDAFIVVSVPLVFVCTIDLIKGFKWATNKNADENTGDDSVIH